MARKRLFRRRRGSVDLWLMLSVQRRTIEMLAGRLDLVQRDADAALEALTEAEGRIADLEARVFGLQGGHGGPPLRPCGHVEPEGEHGQGGHGEPEGGHGGPPLRPMDGHVGPVELPAAIAELPWVEAMAGA